MNKICILTLFLLIISPSLSWGQAIDCREDHPLGLVQRKEMANRMRAWRQKRVFSRQALTDYTIPLVFHILSQSTPGQSTIEQTIGNLNLAFANAGPYENLRGADTQLRFELACKAPDGGETSGVNAVNSIFRIVDADLEHGDLVSTIQWDPSRYLNVWLVDGIAGEALADYEGRTWWTRLGIGGYATGDGIVITSLDVGLIAHEIGHYFGLLHTWQGRDCKNDDCLADGDLVCDTPPDRSVFDSCEDNSCDTDTLSNFSNNTFFADTTDMGTNFMDYGNDECRLDFSLGQAERMQFTIETSYPNLPYELREEGPCVTSCTEDLSVQIDILELYPTIPLGGGSVSTSFSSFSDNEFTNYEWYLSPFQGVWDGRILGELVSTSQDADINFDTEGYFTLYLRAWNDLDESCVATTSVNIRVTCGVVARFSPDKRLIASKQPHALFTDSVTFINRSNGASNYEWIISHENNDPGGMTLPTDTLFEENLTYYFKEPGNYSVSLTASEGECSDQRGAFVLPVEDPTMDGIPVITSVDCTSPTSSTVRFTVFNNGYDTINSITPVAFYDANPLTNEDANYLGGGRLNNIVYGFDSEDFSIRLEQDLASLDELHLAFNVTGEETLPLLFPPGDENKLSTETQFPLSGFSELTYENNVTGFVFGDETSFLPEIRVCQNQPETLLFDDLVDTRLCWDSVLWNSEGQGELGYGGEIDYVTDNNDQINLTLVSSSGVRLNGVINVLATSPEYSVDTVFRIVRGNQVAISFSDQGNYSYEWIPQSGLDDPYSGSVIAGPLENTLYTVTVTDEFGCQHQQQIQVWVETTAHIPDLFTPNQDGSNDRLLIYELREVRDLLFRIVNKEGVLVFSSSSVDELTRNGWSGDKNGQPQPSGAYFWSVEGTYEDGRPVLFNQSQSSSGIIHLVR